MKLSVIILAAGQSKRMRSSRPKVVHSVAGRPMIYYALDAAASLGAGRPILVVGHGAEQVQALVGHLAEYAWQTEQLGTGHAVMQARPLLEVRGGSVLVFYGDMPLLRPETLAALVKVHEQDRSRTPLTMLTVVSDDSMGFGRVVRDASGQIASVVEEAVASEEQRRIKELNCGVYCFEGSWLWSHLDHIPLSPRGEYYLTDLVELAARDGAQISSWTIDDVGEVLGINDRTHLARAEAIMRERISVRWMRAGVTLIDPATTYIEADATVGQDSVIGPNTTIEGETHIGSDCHIGPNAIVRKSRIGQRCRVFASVVESSVLEDDVSVGPFAHLRAGSHLAAGVHMGNFGEVKNSYLGSGTKMGHFSYVGDAQVGKNVNIGAGTITCNYDGVQKHKTVIDDDVFIGSDSMLVAPVHIGAGARTGAGSVVTRDVPAGALAYGVPARIHSRPAPAEAGDSEGGSLASSQDVTSDNA